MACSKLKTRDNLTIKSDLYFAGITQLMTVDKEAIFYTSVFSPRKTHLCVKIKKNRV